MAQTQGPRQRTTGGIYSIVELNPQSFLRTNVAPTIYNHAEQSTLWIQPTTTAGAFVGNAFINVGNFNGQAQWIQISAMGAAGVFTTLTSTSTTTLATTVAGTVNTIGNNLGATSLTLSVGTANFTVNSAAGAALNIGSNAVANTITLGSVTGAAQTNIRAGTGGLNLISAGQTAMDSQTATSASPTATAVINSRVGYAVFTGFTTAAAGKQVFTITDSLSTLTSGIFVTAANLGSNDAEMTVTRVTPGAGSFTVTLTNNGAAALNGDVHLTFWLLD